MVRLLLLTMCDLRRPRLRESNGRQCQLFEPSVGSRFDVEA
jgi:hypothetical protein